MWSRRFSRCLAISLTAVLYSGGKDSHYALIKTLAGGFIVNRLLIVTPLREDSWLFHTVNVRWAVLHAKLMKIEYELVECSGVKDLEVNELREAIAGLANNGFKYVVSGVVQSAYQKAIIDDICRGLGLTHIAPLWREDPRRLLEEEVKVLGFIITAIQAYGLSPKWLGMRLETSNIREFLEECNRHGINPVGDGGEFETLVTESPLFNGRKLCIRASRRYWNPYHWLGYLTIDEIMIC